MSTTLQSGLTMPLMAFGTDKLFGEECKQTLERAISAGFRHIDAASLYKSEIDVGEFLKTCEVSRSSLFITSKAFITQYRNVREACLGSLERLNLDFLDLYLLHWPISYKSTQNPREVPVFDIQDPSNEIDKIPLHQVWKDMEQLVKEGLVKNIGVSNWPIALLNDMLCYAEIPPAVNQFEIHVYNNRKELVEFCIQNNIVPMGYRALYRPNSPKSDFKGCGLDNLVVAEIAQRYEKSPSQVILQWLLARGCGSVSKSLNNERIQSNWNAQFFQLEQEDIDRINRENLQGFFENGLKQYGISIFS